jgi:hypothetical protein
VFGRTAKWGICQGMTENDGRDESEQKASVLIPLDAEEAMLALQRFRRTGAGEAPFVVPQDLRGR